MNLTRRQIALAVSLLFHAALFGVLLVWYVPRAKTSNWSESVDASMVDKDDAENEIAKKTPPPVPEPVDVPDEQIADSVESKITEAQRLSDQRKLSELDKNLKRLESLSSPESVRDVSNTVANSLGLDTGQYADKEPPKDGTFDIDSAQIKDVLRSNDEKGNWKYESIMVDAKGHEQTVPLSAAEGQQLYETFERLKQFPMAKGIYQSVVMPMMQKMLEQAETKKNAADPATEP